MQIGLDYGTVFYVKNPTPPGAAQATSFGSVGNKRNPTPPTHKEGKGESTEASKATRRRQRATRRRQEEREKGPKCRSRMLKSHKVLSPFRGGEMMAENLAAICIPKGGNQEFKGRNLKNLVAIAAKS